ncbi:MAG TPA: hypothetical protein DCF68_15330 [Cyanothece sp. UBA12306]|nr:hypothetical protein [Cyanothece sp. UBA12306]
MSLDPAIRKKYEELQGEYDELTKELNHYRRKINIDNFSPKEEYKLIKQIEETEEKRDVINQKLKRLDQDSNSEQLYKNLLKLGYLEQVNWFVRLLNVQSVASFVIHGSVKYGQRWLLNRLVEQYVPESITGKKIKIDLARAVQKTDLKTLWRELGYQVGLCEILPEPNEIVQRVYRWWQTENVLIVFHDINVIPVDHLQELIINFWNPIAKQARAEIGELGQSDYKLLMFLIDYDGTAENVAGLFAEKLSDTKTNDPLRPPKISKFTEIEVRNWLLTEYPELPISLKHNVDDIIKAILTQSQEGIPEYVLRGIFNRCGYDYCEEVERLWKL